MAASAVCPQNGCDGFVEREVGRSYSTHAHRAENGQREHKTDLARSAVNEMPTRSTLQVIHATSACDVWRPRRHEVTKNRILGFPSRLRAKCSDSKKAE